MKSPILAPFPASSEHYGPKGKGKRKKNGSQAPEPPLQLVTRLEGDEAEERNRAGRMTPRGSPAQNQEPKTPSTPTKPKFSRGKTRLAKGVMNRRGSGSRMQPERDGGNSSRDQEPGRPGNLAPKALDSGRTHWPKKARPRPRDSPGNLHKWKPPFQPGGKQANTAKARPRKPRLGEQKRKTERFSILMHSEE